MAKFVTTPYFSLHLLQALDGTHSVFSAKSGKIYENTNPLWKSTDPFWASLPYNQSFASLPPLFCWFWKSAKEGEGISRNYGHCSVKVEGWRLCLIYFCYFVFKSKKKIFLNQERAFNFNSKAFFVYWDCRSEISWRHQMAKHETRNMFYWIIWKLKYSGNEIWHNLYWKIKFLKQADCTT